MKNEVSSTANIYGLTDEGAKRDFEKIAMDLGVSDKNKETVVNFWINEYNKLSDDLKVRFWWALDEGCSVINAFEKAKK